MRVRRSKTWKRLALALSMIPALIVLEHGGPERIPMAEGCIGGETCGARNSHGLRVERGGQTASIATDGFLVLSTYGLPDPTPLLSMTNASSSCQVALVGASAAGGAVSGFGMVLGLLSLLNRRRARTPS